MRLHFRSWQLALAAVVLCCAVAAVVLWRADRAYDERKLLSLLPASAGETTVGYIDAKALRESGILDLLAGSKASEEPDYRHFVAQTGFDYRTDLDRVAATFLNDGSYFALEGRFQWKQLAAYAAAQGGACRSDFCTMPGSTEERKISFYPVQRDVLALAVTRQPDGASHIHSGAPPIASTVASNNIPSDASTAPVWFSWSSVSSLTARLGSLAPVAQKFLAPLAQARDVTLSAGADGNQFRFRLSVTCASPADAEQLVKQLASVTTALQHVTSTKSNQAAGNQLSGILTAGTFQQKGPILIGSWPFDRAFLKSLTGNGAE